MTSLMEYWDMQHDMTTASNSPNLLTPEELESLRLIVDKFESDVRREATSTKHNGLSPMQKDELLLELGKLQEIKRKLKLMKRKP